VSIAVLVRSEMTDKRDLKRLVRDRQARTGESYMTALRNVLGQRSGSNAVPVIELVDITEVGTPLGIKCAIKMVPALTERIDAAAMLTQLRDALITTAKDPQLALIRSVVLAGERPSVQPEVIDPRPFFARVRAGIGGVSESGRMLAMSVAGRRGAEMVLFWLWMTPVKYVERAPFGVITTPDGFSGVIDWDLFGLELRAR
jgi:hypothetical protein